MYIFLFSGSNVYVCVRACARACVWVCVCVGVCTTSMVLTKSPTPIKVSYYLPKKISGSNECV